MTKADPPVSVVVPTYESAPYVAATLESILGQSYSDFELVVGDHSSSDGTWDIVMSFASRDDRIRVLRTEAGGGAERNWNRVTKSARGGLLKLVCADDLLYPTCLERQVAVMDETPEIALVSCRRDVVDARGNRLTSDRGLGGMVGRIAGSEAVRLSVRAGTNVFGEPACVLLRRYDALSVGGWSAEQGYFIDQDLYVKVLRTGDFYAIPEALAAFRVSSDQWSVRMVAEQGRQARHFFTRVAAESQGLLTDGDVRRAVGRAYASAWARRLAYAWWGSRLHPPSWGSSDSGRRVVSRSVGKPLCGPESSRES